MMFTTVFLVLATFTYAAFGNYLHSKMETCSCVDVLVKDMCKYFEWKNGEVTVFMMLKEAKEHGLVDTQEVSEYEKRLAGKDTSRMNDKCVAYKIKHLMAYLLDKQAPSTTADCGDDNYSKWSCQSFKSMGTWKKADSSCSEDNDVFRVKRDSIQRFFNSFKDIVFKQALSTLPVYNITLKCQPQKQFTMTQVMELFMNSFHSSQQCFKHETHSGMYKKWHEQPIPTGNNIVAAQLTLMFHMNDAVLNYDHETQYTADCGPLSDPLFVAKMTLIPRLQRMILGCQNCAIKDPNEDLKSCTGSERLARKLAYLMTKDEWSKKIYEYLIECHPTDSECIEHRVREIPPAMFQVAMGAIKNTLNCDACQKETCTGDECIDQSEPTLSPENKYFIVPHIVAKLSSACTRHYKEHGLDTKDKNGPYGSTNGQYSTTGTHDPNGGNHKSNITDDTKLIIRKFESAASMAEFRLTYSLLQYTLSLKEANDEKVNEKFYGKPKLKKSTECEKMDDLRKHECEPFHNKLRSEAFLNKFNSLVKCSKIVQKSGLNMCEDDMNAKVKDTCFFDSHGNITNNDVKMMTETAILPGLFFQGCSFSQSPHQFLSSVMQCSYYATLLGRKDKIFGYDDGTEAFYKMKDTKPGLFALDKTEKDLIHKLFQLLRCTDRCPIGFAYCSFAKECLPHWMTCGKMHSNIDAVHFPRMFSDDKLNSESPVGVLSPHAAVILLNRFTDESNKCCWQYNFNGIWHNLTNIPPEAGVKVDQISKVRYMPKTRSYGLRMLYYYDDFSDTVVGSIQKSHMKPDVRVAFLLIHPSPISSNFTVYSYNKTYVLMEDQYSSPGIALKDIVNITTPVNTSYHPIPDDFIQMIPRKELDLFKENILNFEMSRPIGKFVKDVTAYGRLVLEVLTSQGHWISIDAHRKYFPLDYGNSRLVFRPHRDYHGTFDVEIEICDCFAKGGQTASETVSFPIRVESVNDAPVTKSRTPMLPPIAYNLTDEPNLGFSVQELIQYTNSYDVEMGTNMGVIVFKLPKDTYGRWQYSTESGSSWHNISVQNTVDLFKTNVMEYPDDTPVELLYLDNDAQLRFHLNRDKMWRYSEGFTHAFLGFSYWDKQDNSTLGMHNTTMGNLIHSNSYSWPVLGVQLRLGCDGVPGSLGVYDRCGVCGGDGYDCVGCDGVLHSGARYDHCGNCTGGTTGKLYNFNIDCAGTCGMSQLDACSTCQLKSTVREFKDCNSDCFGKARINSCGYCVEGWTGKPGNYRTDVCGVCDGDASTCLGCDGKANSDKLLDVCGNCLSITNPKFNSGCFKINSIDPPTMMAGVSQDLVVEAAGIDKQTKCEFVGFSGSFKLPSFKDIKHGKALTTAGGDMPSGTYKFKCSGGSVRSELYGFKVYGGSATKVDTLSPARVAVNTNNTVTLTGSGFTNTGELGCVALIQNKAEYFPATYIASTTVKCAVSQIKESAKVKLGISLTKRRWSKKDIDNNKLPSKEIEIFAPSASLLSADMTDNFQRIHLKFDHPVRSLQKGCSKIFIVSTTNAFGKNFRCAFKGKLFVVYLGRKSTIKPGDTISLVQGVLVQKFQKIHDAMSAKNIVLQAPKNALKAQVKLSGKTKLGFCDKLVLNGRNTKGSGGKKMTYEWDVEFSENVDVLSSNATDSLVTLKAKLHSSSTKNTIRFHPNDLQFSSLSEVVEYNFSVSVVNFLNDRSPPQYLVVSRTNNILPTVHIRGGYVQSMRAARLNKLQAFARMPKCAGASSHFLDFAWTVDSVGVNLNTKSKSKATLYIYPGTLAGGQSYVLTLMTSFKQDPSMFSSIDVHVDVISSPLIAKIRGGRHKLVSSSQPFTLDASKSRDPDKETGVDEWYEWTCYDSQNYACFVYNAKSDKYERFQLPSSPKAVIEAGTLAVNETYNFTLSYHKGFRVAERSVSVTVKAGSPPTVTAFAGKKMKENIADKIVVRGEVKSVVGRVRVWFECVASEYYAYVNLTQFGVLLTKYERTRYKRGRFPVGLVFAQNVLEAGVAYKLMLYAEDSEGLGFSEVIINTNAAPSIGELLSDVDIGEALNTEFVMSAAEGWEDEEDDLPLTYKFGFYDTNQEKHYLGSPSTENEKVIALPNGDASNNNNLEVFVEVSDIHGATAEAVYNLTVNPLSKIDASAINNVASSIDEAFASDDLSAALGSISSALAVFDMGEVSTANMNASESLQMDEVSETLAAFKQNVTKSVLQLVDDVQDVETQNVVIRSMAHMTNGGKYFSEDLQKDIADKLKTVVTKQIGASQSNPSKRKRRSVDYDLGKVSKTPEEVEYIMKPYVNIITPADISNTSMVNKQTFTSLSADLMASMCRGVAYGQPAVIAEGDLADITVVKNSLVDAHNTSVAMGCENCSAPALKVGEHLQSSFGEWECNMDVNCSGVCIGSARYVDDLYSTDMQRDLATDLVSLFFFNPDQYKVADIALLTSPIEIDIPFKNATSVQYTYECDMWNDWKGEWSTQMCSANPQGALAGHAHCVCDMVGVVSVRFTITKASTKTTPSKHAKVALKLREDYNTITSLVTKRSLEQSITLGIANTLNIESWRIVDMQCSSGSILAAFTFYPPDENTDNNALSTFDDDLARLQTAVKSSSINVTLSTGQSLTVDATFYQTEVISENLPDLTDIKVTPTEEVASKVPYIVGGSVAGVIVFVVIGVFFYKKNQSTGSYPI